jgi:2-oxoisovalerate dehydrogenase E1 component
VVGGEGAPTISKALDMAAHAGPDEIAAGYRDILADRGEAIPQAAE